MITAEIIADSINTKGHRLTTYILRFPRIVLAEFNTHRMFSRNSASSRAIPFKKMLEMVKKDPFIPMKWMKDHSGMQGNEYFDKETCFEAWYEQDRAWSYPEYKDVPAVDRLNQEWLEAINNAISQAEYLSERGVTKQFCNRLLEPFMWHKVIVTATEWENFFALRANEHAEIHIQELANKMLDAYNASKPKQLEEGEWHIPFGNHFNGVSLTDIAIKQVDGNKHVTNKTLDELMVKIATARCARVSYNNFEGKDDYEADIKLHDRLSSSGHWSPFEHCARVMNDAEYGQWDIGKPSIDGNPSGQTVEEGWCGNFRGFIQYRKMFKNENKSDNRVNKKQPI